MNIGLVLTVLGSLNNFPSLKYRKSGMLIGQCQFHIRFFFSLERLKGKFIDVSLTFNGIDCSFYLIFTEANDISGLTRGVGVAVKSNNNTII